MSSMDAIDRLNDIAACIEAVSDLLIPERDLHVVNRDALSQLLRFLTNEYRLASDRLSKSLQQ